MVSRTPVHVPSAIRAYFMTLTAAFSFDAGAALDPPPSHATILCRMTVFFPQNWSINKWAQVVAEVDGIAVDVGYAAIVEAKNSLGSAAAESLNAKLNVLR